MFIDGYEIKRTQDGGRVWRDMDGGEIDRQSPEQVAGNRAFLVQQVADAQASLAAEDAMQAQLMQEPAV